MLPSGIDRQLLNRVGDKFAQQRADTVYHDVFAAYLGKVNDDDSLNPDPNADLPPGRVWIRPASDLGVNILRGRAAVAGYCNVRNDYAPLPVWAGFDRGGNLTAFAVRVNEEAVAQFGNFAASMGVPQVPSTLQNQVINTALLDVALVTPSGSGAFILQVNAYPGAFWASALIDVSGLNNAGVGEVALGIVAHDPVDDGIYLYSPTLIDYAANTNGIDYAFFATLPLPYSVYPLAGVAVANGVTEITNATLAAFGASIVDLRLHVGANGVVNPGWLVKTTTTIPTGASMAQAGTVRVAASLTINGAFYVI